MRGGESSPFLTAAPTGLGYCWRSGEGDGVRTQRDPHEVLGVDPGASRDDVQRAYRSLVQIYHPDRYTEAPESVRVTAEARMKELTEAYGKLRRDDRSRGPTDPKDTIATRTETGAPPSRPRTKTGLDARMRVKHVPGAPHFHARKSAPFGFRTVSGGAILRDGPQCEVLDQEFAGWAREPAWLQLFSDASGYWALRRGTWRPRRSYARRPN